MKAIVRTCWEICLLKRGPQVFPRSPALLAVMLCIYVLMDMVQSLAQKTHGPSMLLQAALDTALFAVFCVLVLSARGLRGRFNQTFVALLGTSILIMMVQTPFILVSVHSGTAVPAYVASWAVVLLMAWGVIVIGHILRHAVNMPFMAGILVACLYVIANQLIFSGLFPVS